MNNEDGEIQEKRIKNYDNEETESGGEDSDKSESEEDEKIHTNGIDTCDDKIEGDEKSDDNCERDIMREENIASSSKYRYFFFKICIVVFDCTF